MGYGMTYYEITELGMINLILTSIALGMLMVSWFWYRWAKKHGWIEWHEYENQFQPLHKYKPNCFGHQDNYNIPCNAEHKKQMNNQITEKNSNKT
jgi:hypothetical protein